MIFVYQNWDKFCKKLQENGLVSIPAKDVTADRKRYLVLKHDVETNVRKAYTIASIEHKYGHRASYYVQGYLLDNEENTSLLRKMHDMGHEISYHYDCMDSCGGDVDKAMQEFQVNLDKFHSLGFIIKTVCQHGNPIAKRNGYHSNRDFFRNSKVKKAWAGITDIMVNFKSDVPTDYLYFSDAGRKFQLIYDPVNNDIMPSDEKNVEYADLDAVFATITEDKTKGIIISSHPHRWQKSVLKAILGTGVFRTIRFIAKTLEKIPVCKRIMSKFYFLAKKI